MPLLDELLGYPSLLGELKPQPQQTASDALPSYEELRSYLAPDVFERFKPHFEAFERMTAPLASRGVDPDKVGTPDARQLPSYEVLRPYLDPEHFEAFRPHFEAFERMTAPSRNASDAPQGPVALVAAQPSAPAPLPSYETLRPDLDPSVFEAFRPQFESFERMTTPRHHGAGLPAAAFVLPASAFAGTATAGASAPSNPAQEPVPSDSYESLRPHIRPELFEALKPQVAQLEAMRTLYGGPWIPADQAAILASYHSPTGTGSSPSEVDRSPFDPSPPAPPLSGGTRLIPELLAPTPFDRANPSAGVLSSENQKAPASASSPSQEFSAGDIDPVTNNVITEVTPRGEIVEEIDDTGQTESEEAQRAAAEIYAQSYEQALGAIDDDPQLRRAVGLMEKAGDRDFRNRLATIIADIQHNPPAAREAIRDEAFNSQFRRRVNPLVGTHDTLADQTRAAFSRLATLVPGLGISEAAEAGSGTAINMEQDRARTINIIRNTPNLTDDEKRRRLREAGVSADIFEAGLLTLLGRPYGGALFGPADRAGGGRGFVPPALGSTARIGRRQNQVIESPTSTLRDIGPKVGRADLDNFRGRIRVVDRHTIGVGKTDIAGLEDTVFEGASPLVRAAGGLPRASPGPIRSPSKHPLETRHAEEDIANQFVRAVEGRGLQPIDLKDRTFRIHLSNPRGVCNTCRQGLEDDRPAGVLKQLSQRYPELNIRVTVETKSGIRQNGPADFLIRNGRYIWRSPK